MLSGRVLTQAEMDVEVQFWDAYRAAPSLPLHMKKTGQWYLKDQLARSSDFSRSSRSSTSREDDLSLNALRRRQQAPKSLSDASVKDSKLLSPSASLKRPMASAKSCQGTPSGKGILNLEVDQIGPKSEPKFFDKFREELSKLLKHGSNSPRRKELEDLAELREVPRRKRSSEKMEEKVIRYPPLEMFLRRRNLTGLHLRCVTESWIPFSENRRLANGTTKIGGILEDVFEQMSIILDFTYTCRQPEDHEFGVFDNGSWSGLMGELVEGRADVAVASLDNTYHRTQYVDFPTPIDFIRYTVFMRQPAPNAWANFTRELSPGSWGTLLLTAATFTIALGCIARCRRHPDHELAPADAWFTVFSFMVNQGSWTVTGLPARILLFMLVLTAWVCLAFYTSNLISALAIPSFFPPFNDLHGLLKKKSHKLGLLRGMSEVDRFRSPGPTIFGDRRPEPAETVQSLPATVRDVFHDPPNGTRVHLHGLSSHRLWTHSRHPLPSSRSVL
ncbi:uncharacterized protein LOC143038484 isoform X2 [Oratosquilla oratoria]|uniref:uncharacterized protein LOC143038484 isoform X2 n=1 Tax=Oratosquilla oratoria TaxID=337810 RepID=UPI003F76CAAD